MIQLSFNPLFELSETNDVDLILTTGGTGFAPRDVTPEATTEVLDLECHGLMAYVTNACFQRQPLASLSRGIVGVLGRSMIATLPGNLRLYPSCCHWQCTLLQICKRL